MENSRNMPAASFIIPTSPAALVRSVPRPSRASRNSVRKAPLRMDVASWDTPPLIPRRVSRSVVWFRPGDLRTDDHAGLDAACAHTADALAPLLVLTPKSMPADLAAAARLRAELQARGSRLVVRAGRDEAQEVAAFVRDFGADRVHVRMDAEAEARDVVGRLERLVDGEAVVQTWVADLREWEAEEAQAWEGMPDEYPQFLRWRRRRDAAVVPSAVEFQPEVIVPGVEKVVEECGGAEEELRRHVGEGEETERRQRFMKRVEEDDKAVGGMRFEMGEMGYGERALREFLKSADRDEEPDLGRSLAEPLRQGALSVRRMYEIVHAHERENGRLWRFLYRAGAKMVLDYLDAREFTTLLARRDVAEGGTVDGEHVARFWRWRGFSVRYVEEGRRDGGKPPLLLVHGFGASSHHYRRSLKVLKENYHVFAIDMVGFGRSEKPPTQYTQDFWELMIWDFVREVVGEPVYIAGNSIGGYLSAAFGSDAYGECCRGICLINTAGKLEDASPALPDPPKNTLFQYVMRHSRFARIIASNFLLRSLRGRIGKTLKLVYPTNPDAADDLLAREIRRDSLDYGAVEVLASGLILPPPRSLTALLRAYEGPLLVFQGVLDPLNNSRERLRKLTEQYPAATIAAVEAGHCPHEEDAPAFVQAISEWMESTNASRQEAVPSVHGPTERTAA